jgi:hypothetical protein
MSASRRSPLWLSGVVALATIAILIYNTRRER